MTDHHDSITERWLELILEHIRDAIIILDRDRVIRFANRAAAELGEVSDPSELLGRVYDEVLAEHDLYDEDGNRPDPAKFPSVVALREGVMAQDVVYRQVHKRTHNQRWLSVSSVPLFVDTKEYPSFAILFFANISVRRARMDRMELLMRSAKVLSLSSDLHTRFREKARILVPLLADWCTINLLTEDGSFERVVVIHRDPSKSGKVERLADIAATHPRSGIVTKVLHKNEPVLFTTVSQEELLSVYTTEEGRALLRELNPTSVMVVPISSGGRVLGVLSMAYGDSGRVYSQDDLEFIHEFCYHLGALVDNSRLYTEVAKRDESKNAFIASLSHELRNPMASIKSALELLQARKDTDPVLTELLSTIDYQFTMVNALLRDLLDINRFARGLVSIEAVPVDLRALLGKTAAIHRPLFAQKNQTLELSLGDAAVYALGEETRLQQAVMNLLSNAHKFTPEGGMIRLSLRADAEYARIIVQDEGTGIAAEDLSGIFDPYAAIRTRPKQGHSGLGLGLVLVHNIVALHHGEVRAHSEGLGMGSTFEIDLPRIAEPEPEQEAEAEQEVIKGPAQRVLVVDDNEAVAKGLSILLRHFGHTVTLAHSGADALAEADAFKPTAVLLDVGLPDMSGHEVARTMRERYGAEPFLVALTGYGQEEDVTAALDAGFNRHLTKPVGIAEIQAVLSELGEGAV